MARDDAAREPKEESSLLDRRSYLQLAGAAAASIASVSTVEAAAQDDGPLVQEKFENDDFGEQFTSTYKQDQWYAQRVSDPVKNGSHSLRVRFPEGTHRAMVGKYDAVDAGDTDSGLEELYASYWLRFSPNFDGLDGGKLPGPGNVEGGRGKGGDPSRGRDWSARGSFRDAGSDGVEIVYYVYHMDMDGSYGDWYGGTTVPRNQWVKVDQHAKLNSVSGGSANSDGELQMWIDDSLKFEKTDFRFTEQPENGINYLWSLWFGGNWTSPKDQSVYFDSWALDDAGKPSLSPSPPKETGDILELVTSDGMATTDYEFTVEGSASKRTNAGDLSSEDNDTVTDNGDGTVTVTGAVGNGYGDSYLVDGSITSMSDLDESMWTIRYEGEEVGVDDLVDSGGPTVDRFDVTESDQLGDNSMFSVRWAVSAADAELDTVEVVTAETAEDLNFAVTDVGGESGSGWDLFQFPVGTELDVSLRATDVEENVTRETETVTL